MVSKGAAGVFRAAMARRMNPISGRRPGATLVRGPSAMWRRMASGSPYMQRAQRLMTGIPMQGPGGQGKMRGPWFRKLMMNRRGATY